MGTAEKFSKTEEELRRANELLRKYEAFTGLTLDMIAAASLPGM